MITNSFLLSSQKNQLYFDVEYDRIYTALHVFYTSNASCEEVRNVYFFDHA